MPEPPPPDCDDDSIQCIEARNHYLIELQKWKDANGYSGGSRKTKRSKRSKRKKPTRKRR